MNLVAIASLTSTLQAIIITLAIEETFQHLGLYFLLNAATFFVAFLALMVELIWVSLSFLLLGLKQPAFSPATNHSLEANHPATSPIDPDSQQHSTTLSHHFENWLGSDTVNGRYLMGKLAAFR
jgi:hypothetical protein